MHYFTPEVTARLTVILKEVIKIETEHRMFLIVKIGNISKFIS